MILQHKIKKWNYDTCKIITRIPTVIGEVWESGYNVQLGKFQCIPATSRFNGSHEGSGLEAEVLLAKDENDNYLLINNCP